MTSPKPILAIIVVYRTKIADSKTYISLRRAVEQEPAVAQQIDIVLADNSPEAQPFPDGVTYLHDGENPGLARRYNQAFRIARDRGAGWLVTMDQDTELTLEYLCELIDLSRTLFPDPTVAVVVPKLFTQEVMRSPMQPSQGRVGYKLTTESTGIIGAPLRAFNSAAMVRVSALAGAGGYPEAYWLDYLDHAMFAELQNRGGRIYIMNSVLKHALAEFTAGEGHNPERRRNIILAEERFYFEFGTLGERVGRKLDLLRQVVGNIRRGRFSIAMDVCKMFCHTRRQVLGPNEPSRSAGPAR